MSICSALAISLQLWTLHTVTVPNSNTFGAGVECTHGAVTYQAGAFANSYKELATYYVAGHDFDVTDKFQLGLFGGIITGYKNTSEVVKQNGHLVQISQYQAPVWHGLTPLLGVQARYALPHGYKASVQLLPGGAGVWLAHLTLNVPLW